MIRSYRYPLLPTKEQAERLSAMLLSCQRLYNGALEHRIKAYEKAKVSVSKFQQFKELAELRQECPEEWGNMSALIQRSSLKRLDKAFEAFFRRIKLGQKPGLTRRTLLIANLPLVYLSDEK